VSHRIAKLLLFVVLAFQLAVGLLVQAAQAGATGASSDVARAAGDHCASHVSPDRTIPDHMTPGHVNPDYVNSDHLTAAAHHSFGAPVTTHTHHGAGVHDCCRANSCQCHCASGAAMPSTPARATAVPSIVVQAPASAQLLPTPIDEFLRPPIA
jgi:hypothetical protein